MQRYHRTPVSIVIALLPILALGPAACQDTAGVDDPDLAGGVLATFEVVDEEFTVWTTSETAISQLEALRDGDSQANIPLAPVRTGPGRGDHNEPWSWHLDPDELSMAEVTIEVCSGRPSLVEEDVDHWIDTVGRYCPWTAELVELEDFR